jgi:hypothetical protein
VHQDWNAERLGDVVSSAKLEGSKHIALAGA